MVTTSLPPAARPGVRELWRELSRSGKKPAPGAPPYSVHINRPVGRLIAAVCAAMGISANGATAVSAVLTLGGVVLIPLAPGTPLLGILAGLLLALGYAFDSADGQLARYAGGGTLFGEWLDHVVDAAKLVLVHGAILLAAWGWSERPSDVLLLVPIIFAGLASVNFFAMILNEQLARRAGATARVAPQAGPRTQLKALLLLPTDYGVLCLGIVLLGWPTAFFALYILLAAALAGSLLVAIPRWGARMARLDAAVDDV